MVKIPYVGKYKTKPYYFEPYTYGSAAALGTESDLLKESVQGDLSFGFLHGYKKELL